MNGNQRGVIVMLAGQDESTRWVYHALSSQFDIHTVVLEEPVSRSVFLKRRMKNLGFFHVAGQVLFQLLAAPLLHRSAAERVEAILNQNELQSGEIPNAKVKQVKSANDEEVIKLLQDIQPSIVILNGTRIISKRILEATSTTFINMHTGITPKYRGVHGGYWALINHEPELCGVTIHYVDTGIDTGEVAAQGLIEVTPDDNYATYPVLQTALGIELMADVLEQLLEGKHPIQQPLTKASALWSHPTLWSYTLNRFCKGIK